MTTTKSQTIIDILEKPLSDTSKQELAEVILEVFLNDFVVIGDNNGYVFNHSTKLWEFIRQSEFKSYAQKIIDYTFDQYIFDKEKFRRMTNDLHLRFRQFFFHQHFEDNLNGRKGYIPIRGGRVLNLWTLEITPRTWQDYFTYEVDVDLVQEMKEGERVLLDFANENQNVSKDMCRLIWKCMSGGRGFYQLVGEGGTGKSTFLEIIKKLTGDTFIHGTKDDFTDTPSFNIARFNQKRVISFCETDRTPERLYIIKKYMNVKDSYIQSKVIFQLCEPVEGGVVIPFTKKFKGGVTGIFEREIFDQVFSYIVRTGRF